MRNAFFWISLPFLLPQALWVRRRAIRFRDAGGIATGTAGTGAEIRLVAVGDSIIAGVGARTLENALVACTARSLSAALDCRVNWSAFGRTGVNSSRALIELLPLADESPADVYLVSLGVNDVTSLTTLNRWQENIVALIDYLSATSPQAVLAFVGLPPMHIFPALPQPLRAVVGFRARSVDDRLQVVCRRIPAAVHIPVAFEAGPGKFAGDGYHPSEESYAAFGKGVADCIAKRLTATRAAGEALHAAPTA